MANFVLDKGYEASGDEFSSNGVSAYHFVAFGAADEQTAAQTVSGGLNLGVAMETVDAAKISDNATKVVFNVRVLGIAPVVAGTGGVSLGQQVVSDTDGTAVTGTSGDFVGGITLQAGSAGDIVNVLLTPGATL